MCRSILKGKWGEIVDPVFYLAEKQAGALINKLKCIRDDIRVVVECADSDG